MSATKRTAGVSIRAPGTVTELRRCLDARRARTSRQVFLNRPFRRLDGHVQVWGPPADSDKLLTVHLRSGLTHLDVMGGWVRVVASSSWGNAVTLCTESDQVSVHVPWADVKVSVYGLVRPEQVTGNLGRTRVWSDLP